MLLDPDVAEVFTSPESVNAVLRALIATMPRSSSDQLVRPTEPKKVQEVQ